MSRSQLLEQVISCLAYAMAVRVEKREGEWCVNSLNTLLILMSLCACEITGQKQPERVD